MAEKDITLSMGGDPKDLIGSLDKVEKKLGDTATAAKKVGDTSKSVEREMQSDEGPDFGGVGKGSKKASAGVERLGGALAALASGEMNPHEFALVFRDVTGTMGAFATTAGKAGGTVGAMAPVMSKVAGLAGPIAIALAGVSAIYAIWNKIHEESEKAAEAAKKAQEEQIKRLEQMRKQAEQLETSMSRAFAPRGAPEATAHFRRVLTDLEKPAVAGLDLHAFVEQVTQARLPHEGKQTDIGEEATLHEREETLKLLHDAAEGFATAQARVQGAFDQLLKNFGAGQRVAASPIGRAAGLITKSRDEEEEAKAQAIREAERKAAEDAEQATRDEELKELKRQDDEQRRLIDAGVDLVTKQMATGDDFERSLASLGDALKDQLGPDGLRQALQGVRDAFHKVKGPLEQLADEIQKRADAQKAAHDREEAERKAKEKEKADEAAANQKIVAEKLQSVVNLLEQLNGNQRETFDRIFTGLTKAGVKPDQAQAIADMAVHQAVQVFEQRGLGKQVDRGLRDATGQRGFKEAIADALHDARQRKGAPLSPDEVRQIRQTTAQETREKRQADIEALGGRQQKRREDVEDRLGRPMTRREVEQMMRQEAAERRDVMRGGAQQQQQGGGRGDQLGGQMDATKDAVQQLGQNFPKVLQDLINNQVQLATALANMNQAAEGGRAAAQHVQQVLSGPGTRR